ncbi:hypothetical protein MFIFM68171_05654 [Madurella fahalii]|uniref:Uncharacterized protein n=1 Tax=Madurella fahalii TaxID=1157608 RepID=A0ABQ0GCE3_9PEZI
MFLTLDLLPRRGLQRRHRRARNRLAKSFQTYYAEGHYRADSAYVRRWTEHSVSQGISAGDIGRCYHNRELFALVANTNPAAFWTVFRVFSDPSVAEDCQEEVLQVVTAQEEEGENGV